MQDGFDPDFPLIADNFNSDAPKEGRRTVRDVEGVVSVHHDGLRISPLATVGWNRAAVQYGGHRRRDGLALAVGLLNGHNGSEPFRQTSLLRQIRRGTIGSGTDPLLKRLTRLPFRLKRESLYRRLECWVKARRPAVTADGLGGNLAIGWFDEASPAAPRCRRQRVHRPGCRTHERAGARPHRWTASASRRAGSEHSDRVCH